MGVLEFLNGERGGSGFRCPMHAPCSGGIRSAISCSIKGPSAGSMRRFRCVDGEYFIEDLKSRNGTLVNGQIIEAAHPLHDGDELKICDMALTFHQRSRHAGQSGSADDRYRPVQ